MNGKRIRPLKGEVLIYMDAPDDLIGSLHVPEKHQERSRFGEVRRLGIWRQNRRGALISFPVTPGDRVFVRAGSGRWMHSEKERLKLVNSDDILAILEKD